MVRCLRARVPAMTLPANTMHTSLLASSLAYSRLSYRFWLGGALDQVRECRCGVCHRVRAMHDHETVVVPVRVLDHAGYAQPVRGAHVAGVYVHGLDHVHVADVGSLGNKRDQLPTRKPRVKAALRRYGGDGPTRCHNEDVLHADTPSSTTKVGSSKRQPGPSPLAPRPGPSGGMTMTSSDDNAITRRVTRNAHLRLPSSGTPGGDVSTSG